MDDSGHDDWKAMGFKSEADYRNWLRQQQFQMQSAQDRERAKGNEGSTRGPLMNSPDPEHNKARKDRRLPLSPMRNMYDSKLRDITVAPKKR